MIQIRDLSKSFGEKKALFSLTKTLPDAGTILIAGVSGTGKTTLLRILAGLLRQDSGTVEGLANRRVGFVFQEDRLLPWCTALENVALASDEKTAERYLDLLGLSEAKKLYPKSMSGGMKRRAAIARALSFSDDVLLLDEPFTGLDAENRAIAASAIRERTKLVILVTHEASDLTFFHIDHTVRL